jgi:hypothetical protein
MKTFAQQFLVPENLYDFLDRVLALDPQDGNGILSSI